MKFLASTSSLWFLVLLFSSAIAEEVAHKQEQGAYKSCSIECVELAAKPSCTILDADCICNAPTIKSAILSCLKDNCTPEEQWEAMQTGVTTCLDIDAQEADGSESSSETVSENSNTDEAASNISDTPGMVPDLGNMLNSISAGHSGGREDVTSLTTISENQASIKGDDGTNVEQTGNAHINILPPSSNRVGQIRVDMWWMIVFVCLVGHVVAF